MCYTFAMSRCVTPLVLRVRIKLLHTRFEIVRVVELSSRVRLAEVHNLIQAVMPWSGSHLHRFHSQAVRWGLPDSDAEDCGIAISDERITTIGAAFVESDTEPLVYLYDFGDGWEHELSLEDVANAGSQTTYPRLIEAVGACPPEDVGGVSGYSDFIAALSDPKSADHSRLSHWHGRPFDPNQVDASAIQQRLSDLSRRWSRDAN